MRLQAVCIWVLCHIQIYVYIFAFLLPPFPPILVDDVNANPNKRQRQPALLGDHPSEYGKALTPEGSTNTHRNSHHLWMLVT